MSSTTPDREPAQHEVILSPKEWNDLRAQGMSEADLHRVKKNFNKMDPDLQVKLIRLRRRFKENPSPQGAQEILDTIACALLSALLKEEFGED